MRGFQKKNSCCCWFEETKMRSRPRCFLPFRSVDRAQSEEPHVWCRWLELQSETILTTECSCFGSQHSFRIFNHQGERLGVVECLSGRRSHDYSWFVFRDDFVWWESHLLSWETWTAWLSLFPSKLSWIAGKVSRDYLWNHGECIKWSKYRNKPAIDYRFTELRLEEFQERRVS